MNLDRMFGRYRAMLCGATLLMVGLSWPLWVDWGDFPRVPFVSGTPILAAWVSWIVLGGIMATLAAAVAGWRWRLMLRLNLPFLTFAILQDQNRFQPWAYQYAVIGLAMTCSSKTWSMRMARWYVSALYFYSGLSKLDASFCRELGPIFLGAALGPFGLSTGNWTESARTAACLAMPSFEIVVAMLLVFEKTRRIGLVGAIAQHSALFFILGPWNLDHSTIVLVWNLAMIVEDLILFGPTMIAFEIERDSLPGRASKSFFWLVMLLPSVERLGLCDAWPGHALYAAHAERSDLFVHEDDLERFSETIRLRLGPSGLTPWRRLDMTGWSRDVRGTPPYPSGRVGNAVAEFLELRFGGPQPIRLVHWERASAWDGIRKRDESRGLRAIRQRGDRFFLNAHPAGLGRP